MWPRFRSTGTCDISKDLFTIATIIGASSLLRDLSSQVGIGSRLQDLSGEDSMMPMFLRSSSGQTNQVSPVTSPSNGNTRSGVSARHRELRIVDINGLFLC